jgi:hypothetical protein
VWRAVIANVVVAAIGAIALLVADRWLLPAIGASPAAGAVVALYVTVVLTCGSLLTWRWVELPSGAGNEPRRSPWAALLGLLAGVPIVYLALVLTFQVIRPALG